MAEEQKPIAVAAEPATAVAPAPTPVALPTAEPVTTEVKPETTEAAATTEEAKPVEAATAEEKKAKVAEPIYKGKLGYKEPGLIKGFRFSTKYFWFGEEPVPTANLSHYLRGEKPEVAHPTAAWASHTGKGLLFFVKHEENKEHPNGVLNLSEVSDLSKDGAAEFVFKLHGHKHTFQAANAGDRDGWFLALEQAIKEAKESKETIVASEGYTENLKKLAKPTGPVAAAAAAKPESSVPKKSTEVKPDAQRAGSSSSSSSDSDKEKKKKAAKSKSRSASRGKRASIFGSLLGKKDEEKKEEVKPVEAESSTAAVAPKEEKAAEAPIAAITEPSAAPAVPAAEVAQPTETAATAETTPAVAATETPAATTATTETTKPTLPKASKRGSIFGALKEKMKSPTSEKKESELIPAIPAKDTKEVKETEAPAAAPAAVTAETSEPSAAAPVAPVVPTEETKAAPAAAATTTPHKEKKNLWDSFLGKDKAKSPAAEVPPAVPPKTEEAVAPVTETAPVEAVAPVEAPKVDTEAPKVDTEAPAATTAAAPATSPEIKDKRRTSFFGGFGAKKDKKADATEGEQGAASKLSGLFRNPSKAVKGKKDAAKTEDKAPEAAKEDVPPVPAVPAAATTESTTTTEAAPVASEPQTIGDVVPEAISVGQPKSQVPATA